MSAPIKVHESFGLNSQFQQLLWWDDFLGDQLDDRWTTTAVGGGTAVVVDAQTGGIVRIATGATSADSAEINWNDIRSLHVDQNICVEARVKLSHITTIDARICSLRFDANEQFAFFIDTNGSPNIRIISQNVGATIEDTLITPDTDYHVYRIEATATSIAFFYDDVEVTGSPITTNIPNDVGDFLQPDLFCRARDDADRNIDVDYVVVRQDR